MPSKSRELSEPSELSGPPALSGLADPCAQPGRAQAAHAHPSFLRNGGEMGGLIRAHDWAATPLGPPSTWPHSLRCMVGACINSPVLGTVLWGEDLLMIYNDAYSVSLGERHPGALGRPVREVWGASWDAVAPRFLAVLETGDGLLDSSVELPVARNGRTETTYWDFTVAPIFGDDGAIGGLFNQGTETTAQVQASRALRQANETLESRVVERTRDWNRLWTLSEDLLVIADYDGQLLSVNPSWTRLFGMSEQALLDGGYPDIIHPDDLGIVVEALNTMRDTGKPANFQDRVRNTAGEYLWISWKLSPEPGGKRLIGVGRDITGQKARQAELDRTEAALRQSQKMEAVGQLTGGLAHDFNNLLTGISGSLELMRRRLAAGQLDAAQTERYIDIAHGAASRAAALTHRLLAFARRQTLDPRPTDINRLVAGMEELLRRTVGPAIDIDIRGADGLWPALVDAGQLDNALLNLCLNARDAMRGGGKLTIATANLAFDRENAPALELEAGDYLSLCVTDTGAGMSADVIARAFEPFFTTKPLGEGTGLGLSMVYGFAQQSGGQIRIESEPGQGATICIYLPRYHGAVMDETAPPPAKASLPQRQATALVVDDEPAVRVLVTEILREIGVSSVEAGDGPAALEALSSAAPLDMMITDIGLPGGFNGRQLGDAARALRPDLKILFITGYAEHAVLGEGLLDGGMQLLTKPFAIDDLIGSVQRLIKS